MIFLLFILLALLAIADGAQAATITAASCELSAVKSAINSAVISDTVLVPPGNCTWNSNLTITKGINLIGAGAGSTIITSSYTGEFLITYTPSNYSANWPFRISGMTFNFDYKCSGINFDYSSTDYTIQTKIRIDHNDFRNAADQAIWINGQRGVADNNNFTGTGYPIRFGNGASYEWWQNWEGLIFGKADNNFYFEDNTISASEIMVDCQYGNRYAFRYNTISTTDIGGSFPLMDMHGNQTSGGSSGTAGMYSCFGAEIYGNRIQYPNISGYAGQVFDQRGGKAVVFYNLISGASDVDMVKIRETDSDANQPTSNPQPQHVSDSYYWNNKLANGSVVIAYEAEDIPANVLQENREWFDYKTSFNGTVGVGAGTMANRPSNCTPGVGYWATAQSVSNLTEMVGANPSNPISGTLYKCVSTNTWSAFYIPYVYPHPLRNEGLVDTTAPATPGNVRVN